MDVIIERDVTAKMRDGTLLRADIYRPAADGRYPAVMQRNPYGKDGARAAAFLDPVVAAADGLVVVAQDTRGQGASEGNAFYPFRDDFHDGYDTAEWVSALPYANGRVGAYGVSYGGNSSWQAAVAAPPSLGAIAPIQSPIDWVDGWHILTRNGVLKWGLTLNWSLMMAESQVRKYATDPADLTDRLERLADVTDRFTSVMTATPLTAVEDLMADIIGPGRPEDGPPLGFFGDVLRRQIPAEWRDGLGFPRSHSRVQVPVFLIGGWYDVILGHDLEHFARMRTEAERDDTRLLIGPWSHSNFTNLVGSLDYGRRSTGVSIDMGLGLSGVLIDWFKRRLTPEVAAIPDDGPRVRVFVQGIDRWRDEDDWPIPRAQPTAWYLRADGALSREAPAAGEGYDTYVYDPRDPCPTVGGDLVKPPEFAPGPMDQGPILARRDVLVYTTDVLERDVEVIGPVTATLSVATTGRGTDWMVKVCDIDERARTINICDGVVRTDPVAGDGVQECDVDLWGAAVVFRAGHRIRVIVSSSDFPRYERNPNTGENPWQASVFEPALQRVFHDGDRASRIVLPVTG